MNSVVICLDEKYIQGAVALVNSINSFNKNVVFYILYDYLSCRSKYIIEKYLYRCLHKLIHIRISRNIPTVRYFSPISCGRIYIAEYIDEEQCLYLDSDTLCVTNLDYLFNIDLDEKIIGAVVDPRYSKLSDQLTSILRDRVNKNFLDKPAFNSGVLLINLKLWREHNLTEKMIDWIVKNISFLTLPDQSALNFFTKGDFYILDNRWNVCLYKTKLNYNQVISILHFNGQEKPWMSNKLKFKKLWMNFYNKEVE